MGRSDGGFGMGRWMVPAFLAVGLCAPAAPAQDATESPTPTTETAPVSDAASLSLADFDAAWNIVARTHFDPTLNGVDWDAARERLRPKAAQATTPSERRRVINQLVDLLGQSHFGVIPGELADAATRKRLDEHAAPAVAEDTTEESGELLDTDTPTEAGVTSGVAQPGIEVRPTPEGLLVTTVRPGSPADVAGVEPGWIVRQIGYTNIDQVRQRYAESVGADKAVMQVWQTAEAALRGSTGSAVTVRFVDGDDNDRTLSLERIDPEGEMVRFGNLPPQPVHIEWRWLESGRMGMGGARIGVIRFNLWMTPILRGFERAMYELRNADGIVIDLRGNLGGVGGLAMGVGGYLYDEPAQLGQMLMRGNTINFAVNPRLVASWGELRGQAIDPYTGPIALLVDPMTASTSEIFAAGLHATGRARVFGQTTPGLALPALMSKLPSGDVLMHAMADFEDPTGTSIEGRGVTPDDPTTLTRADLLTGHDAALEAAARWIDAHKHQSHE